MIESVNGCVSMKAASLPFSSNSRIPVREAPSLLLTGSSIAQLLISLQLAQAGWTPFLKSRPARRYHQVNHSKHHGFNNNIATNALCFKS